MNKSVMSFAIVSNLLLASIFASLQGMENNPLNVSDIPNLSSNNPLYLMYLTMGRGFCGKMIDNNYIMKSDAQSLWYNRVYTIGNSLSTQDIDKVLDDVGQVPFGWWVSTEDLNVSEALKAKGFSTDVVEPAMIVDLANFSDEQDEKFNWKKCENEADLNEWIETSAAGFGISVNIQKAFVEFIKNNANMSDCYFYLGLLDGKPASTGLMIEHRVTKTASLHLVSTISEYRKQGLATMLSKVAMMQAKNNGCTHMILLSSPIAHPLYQDLGFYDYKSYAIYTLQKDLVQDDLGQDPSSGSSWCLVM